MLASYQQGACASHPTQLGCAHCSVLYQLCHAAAAFCATHNVCVHIGTMKPAPFASKGVFRAWPANHFAGPACCMSVIQLFAYCAANSGPDICQYGGHSCHTCDGGHSRHVPAASVSHARSQPAAHVHVQQPRQDAEHEPSSNGSLPLLRSSHGPPYHMKPEHQALLAQGS